MQKLNFPIHSPLHIFHINYSTNIHLKSLNSYLALHHIANCSLLTHPILRLSNQYTGRNLIFKNLDFIATLYTLRPNTVAAFVFLVLWMWCVYYLWRERGADYDSDVDAIQFQSCFWLASLLLITMMLAHSSSGNMFPRAFFCVPWCTKFHYYLALPLLILFSSVVAIKLRRCCWRLPLLLRLTSVSSTTTTTTTENA